MLEAVKDSQAQLSGQLQEGFAQLQSSVLAVQQSLDVVQASLDYIAVNIQSIQSAISTVQSQITVRGCWRQWRRRQAAPFLLHCLLSYGCTERGDRAASKQHHPWLLPHEAPPGCKTAAPR